MAYRLHTTVSWQDTMRDLSITMAKWGVHARDWSVSPATPPRPRSGLTPDEAAVTVRFVRDGREQRVTLTTQPLPRDNLRAIYLGLESMRMNDVRGIGDVVRDLYLQLPAPAVTRDPYEVLGIRPDTPLVVAEAAYKALSKAAHPDVGGTEEQMRELNAAWERVKGER